MHGAVYSYDQVTGQTKLLKQPAGKKRHQLYIGHALNDLPGITLEPGYELPTETNIKAFQNMPGHSRMSVAAISNRLHFLRLLRTHAIQHPDERDECEERVGFVSFQQLTILTLDR
jgi:hypothetical protein